MFFIRNAWYMLSSRKFNKVSTAKRARFVASRPVFKTVRMEDMSFPAMELDDLLAFVKLFKANAAGVVLVLVFERVRSPPLLHHVAHHPDSWDSSDLSEESVRFWLHILLLVSPWHSRISRLRLRLRLVSNVPDKDHAVIPVLVVLIPSVVLILPVSALTLLVKAEINWHNAQVYNS